MRQTLNSKIIDLKKKKNSKKEVFIRKQIKHKQNEIERFVFVKSLSFKFLELKNQFRK